MPITKQIKVIKVPLPREKQFVDRPIAFPRMPRLYLELIENKDKIKQNLINKEYVPPLSSHKQFESKEIKETFEKKNISSSESSPETPEIKDPYRHEEGDRDKDRDKDRDINKDIDKDSDKSSESKHEDESESESEKEDSPDDLSKRLKELLADTSDSVEDFDSFKKKLDKNLNKGHDKYSRQHKSPLEVKSARVSPYKQHFQTKRAPTLAELEKKGHYQMKSEMRDVNRIGMDEQEENDKKREILFKFSLLKKSYPKAATTIPEFTVHSDLNQMQKEYDSNVRRLSLDSTVDSYKSYLVAGFMGTEFIFGNFLGFDMQGFTQQQIINMSSYERLLIELGEKSYVPTGSRWPVELRLLMLVIINAAVFIVSKMIMRKTGANLMNMINTMGGSSSGNVPDATPVRKHRMKGPNIDLSDIPDVNNMGVPQENN